MSTKKQKIKQTKWHSNNKQHITKKEIYTKTANKQSRQLNKARNTKQQTNKHHKNMKTQITIDKRYIHDCLAILSNNLIKVENIHSEHRINQEICSL